jgi:SAM-dependent methyltransferase
VTHPPREVDPATAWHDPEYVSWWAHGDDLGDLLALPRSIAAALVATDRPEPALVVDLGSGPGDFLAVFLDAFPTARGVWTDVSRPMLELARERLAPYGDRVDYRLADMADLDGADLPAGVDVVTTSRASHHLDPGALAGFYRRVAGLLAPGGWLVNLDHMSAADPAWDGRLRAARRRFRVHPERERAGHLHTDRSLPTAAEHLAALSAAGVDDVEIAWRAFVTCLLVGRLAG